MIRKLLPLLFLVLMLPACMNDDDYTLSPSDKLTFSTDTVAFDTIISGMPTNTYAFTVYNRAKKAVRIPRVYLEKGAASHFQVNVDGTPLTNGEASDFEIAAEDSMIVYLFANVPEADSDEPQAEEESLVFQTEAGASQKVLLTASGQSVIPLQGLVLTADSIFASHRPYHVIDSLIVAEGATLVLMPGTRMYFRAGAKLIVNGTLQILGTLGNEVVLRGDRLGNMFAGQPYDRIPNQWGGVEIRESSYGNYFSYADIHSGNFGVRVDSCDISRSSLVMENSIIHNTKGNALDVRMAQVYVGNSQITNAGANCVKLRGGDATFVHCTIARFYVFTGGSGVALDFANYDAGVRLPIKSAQFANCLITGYQEDEVMGSQNTEYPDDLYNYAFFNCLFNTTHPEKEDNRLVNCLWDDAEGENTVKREDNFDPEFDTDALLFTFQLNPLSQAIGNADAEITAITYPTDRLGRNRVANGTVPDIGCYQHVPQQTPN